MRISAHACEWLNTLRAHTAAAHRSLENHPLLSPLGEGEPCANAYVRALRALAAPQLAMESATAAYAERHGSLTDYESLTRSPWLLDDLKALATQPFALNAAWPACDTPAAYVGTSYVLEGSRFGAQVIASRLKRFLPDLSACTFFSRTPAPQWPNFVESASAYETDAGSVAHAANSVFRALQMHLDTTLAEK